MEESEPTREQLLARNAELERRLEEKEETICQLTALVEQLRKEVEQLKNKPPVSAAPFRLPKKRKKTTKKSPGRKKGHEGASRSVPKQVDKLCEPPHEQCPQCRERVEVLGRHEQYVEELLPPRRHVTKHVSYRVRCPGCGLLTLAGPDHPPEARGCAKVRIGPAARTLVAYLKASLGMTIGKIRRFFGEFGMKITDGWIAAVQGELAENLAGTWQGLLEKVRTAPSAHMDETGWYVGEPGWQLLTFAEPETAVFLVEPTRSSDVVRRVLGRDYDGVLVSDCLSIYDPIECRKQKCYSHHLKALSGSIERLPDDQTEPLKRLRMLLRASLALYHTRESQPEALYLRRVANLKAAVAEILDETYPGTGLAKALNRFRTHREHLFTHLELSGVAPTNNLAERCLRFGVISRKLSCGNRTIRGASIWQTLTSVASTCKMRGESFWELALRSFRDPQPNTNLFASPG
jgi:hypothetical protein